jgi:hypothetical protein
VLVCEIFIFQDFRFVLKLANLLNETGEFDFQIFGRRVARGTKASSESRGAARGTRLPNAEHRARPNDKGVAQGSIAQPIFGSFKGRQAKRGRGTGQGVWIEPASSAISSKAVRSTSSP